MGPINGEIFLFSKLGPTGIPIKWRTETLSIGSDKSCDGYINSELIDSMHCILTLLPDGHACITHTGSKSCKTFVEGIEITEPKILKHKSIFTVGDVSFMFMYPRSSKFSKDQCEPSVKCQPFKNNLPIISTPKCKTYTIHCHKTNSPKVSPISVVNTKIKTITPKTRLNVRPFVSPIQNKLIMKSGRKSKLNLNLIKSAESRRHVSFGPNLSPEQFDKELPPIQPLKKGETPMKSKAELSISSSLEDKNDESSDTYSHLSNDQHSRKRFSVISSENSTDYSDKNKLFEETDFSLTRNTISIKDDSFVGKSLIKSSMISNSFDSPIKRVSYTSKERVSRKKSLDLYEYSLENEKLNKDDISLNDKIIMDGSTSKSFRKLENQFLEEDLSNRYRTNTEKRRSRVLKNKIDYLSTHLSSTPIKNIKEKYLFNKSKKSNIHESGDEAKFENNNIFSEQSSLIITNTSINSSTTNINDNRENIGNSKSMSGMYEIRNLTRGRKSITSDNEKSEENSNISEKVDVIISPIKSRRKTSVINKSMTSDNEIDNEVMKNLFTRKSIERRSADDRKSKIFESTEGEKDVTMDEKSEKENSNISEKVDVIISPIKSRRETSVINKSMTSDNEIDNEAMQYLFTRKSIGRRSAVDRKSKITESERDETMDEKSEKGNSNISEKVDVIISPIKSRRETSVINKSMTSDNEIDNEAMQYLFTRKSIGRRSAVDRKSKITESERDETMDEKSEKENSNISEKVDVIISPIKSRRKTSVINKSMTPDNEIDNEVMKNLFTRKSIGRRSAVDRKSKITESERDETMDEKSEKGNSNISEKVDVIISPIKSRRKTSVINKSMTSDNEIDNEAMQYLFTRKSIGRRSAVDRKSKITESERDETMDEKSEKGNSNISEKVDVIISPIKSRRKTSVINKSMTSDNEIDNEAMQYLFTRKSIGRRSAVDRKSKITESERDETMDEKSEKGNSNISEKVDVIISPIKSRRKTSVINKSMTSDNEIDNEAMQYLFTRKSIGRRSAVDRKSKITESERDETMDEKSEKGNSNISEKVDVIISPIKSRRKTSVINKSMTSDNEIDNEAMQYLFTRKSIGRRSAVDRKSKITESERDETMDEKSEKENSNISEKVDVIISPIKSRRKTSVINKSMTSDNEIDNEAMKNLFTRKSIGRRSVVDRKSKITESERDETMDEKSEKENSNISEKVDVIISPIKSRRKTSVINKSMTSDNEIDNEAMKNLFTRKSIGRRSVVDRKSKITESERDETMDEKSEKENSNISEKVDVIISPIKSRRKTSVINKSMTSDNEIDNEAMQYLFTRKSIGRRSAVDRKSKIFESTEGEKDVTMDEKSEKENSNISEKVDVIISPIKSRRKTSVINKSMTSDNEIDNEAMKNLFTRKSIGRRSVVDRKSKITESERDETMDEKSEKGNSNISEKVDVIISPIKSRRKTSVINKSMTSDNEIDNEAMQYLFTRKSIGRRSVIDRKSKIIESERDETMDEKSEEISNISDKVKEFEILQRDNKYEGEYSNVILRNMVVCKIKNFQDVTSVKNDNESLNENLNIPFSNNDLLRISRGKQSIISLDLKEIDLDHENSLIGSPMQYNSEQSQSIISDDVRVDNEKNEKESIKNKSYVDKYVGSDTEIILHDENLIKSSQKSSLSQTSDGNSSVPMEKEMSTTDNTVCNKKKKNFLNTSETKKYRRGSSLNIPVDMENVKMDIDLSLANSNNNEMLFKTDSILCSNKLSVSTFREDNENIEQEYVPISLSKSSEGQNQIMEASGKEKLNNFISSTPIADIKRSHINTSRKSRIDKSGNKTKFEKFIRNASFNNTININDNGEPIENNKSMSGMYEIRNSQKGRKSSLIIEKEKESNNNELMKSLENPSQRKSTGLSSLKKSMVLCQDSIDCEVNEDQEKEIENLDYEISVKNNLLSRLSKSSNIEVEIDNETLKNVFSRESIGKELMVDKKSKKSKVLEEERYKSIYEKSDLKDLENRRLNISEAVKETIKTDFVSRNQSEIEKNKSDIQTNGEVFDTKDIQKCLPGNSFGNISMVSIKSFDSDKKFVKIPKNQNSVVNSDFRTQSNVETVGNVEGFKSIKFNRKSVINKSSAYEDSNEIELRKSMIFENEIDKTNDKAPTTIGKSDISIESHLSDGQKHFNKIDSFKFPPGLPNESRIRNKRSLLLESEDIGINCNETLKNTEDINFQIGARNDINKKLSVNSEASGNVLSVGMIEKSRHKRTINEIQLSNFEDEPRRKRVLRSNKKELIFENASEKNQPAMVKKLRPRNKIMETGNSLGSKSFEEQKDEDIVLFVEGKVKPSSRPKRNIKKYNVNTDMDLVKGEESEVRDCISVEKSRFTRSQEQNNKSKVKENVLMPKEVRRNLRSIKVHEDDNGFINKSSTMSVEKRNLDLKQVAKIDDKYKDIEEENIVTQITDVSLVIMKPDIEKTSIRTRRKVLLAEEVTDNNSTFKVPLPNSKPKRNRKNNIVNQDDIDKVIIPDKTSTENNEVGLVENFNSKKALRRGRGGKRENNDLVSSEELRDESVAVSETLLVKPLIRGRNRKKIDNVDIDSQNQTNKETLGVLEIGIKSSQKCQKNSMNSHLSLAMVSDTTSVKNNEEKEDQNVFIEKQKVLRIGKGCKRKINNLVSSEELRDESVSITETLLVKPLIRGRNRKKIDNVDIDNKENKQINDKICVSETKIKLRQKCETNSKNSRSKKPSDIVGSDNGIAEEKKDRKRINYKKTLQENNVIEEISVPLKKSKPNDKNNNSIDNSNVIIEKVYHMRTRSVRNKI